MASSKGAVLSALVGNSLLTVLKFGAFALSGSGAMFSEAMHSLADTANQTLLYVGIRSSERPADALFHYGYGGDRYLFSLLSAVGIFVLGCGVTLYHGVHSLLHPKPLEINWIPFVVLGISLVVDGLVMATAIRTVWARKGEQSMMRYLRTTSDPTVAAVLLEDGVACFGVIVALVAILMAQWTGSPSWDALGALAVSGMLGGVAVWLGIKNRKLLLGPAMPKNLQAEVVAFLREDPAVKQVRAVKSRVVGAERFRFQAELDFDGAYLGARLAQFSREQAPRDDQAQPHAEFAARFGDRLVDELAMEIDRIERDMTKRFPALAHVDLEAD